VDVNILMKHNMLAIQNSRLPSPSKALTNHSHASYREDGHLLHPKLTEYTNPKSTSKTIATPNPLPLAADKSAHFVSK